MEFSVASISGLTIEPLGEPLSLPLGNLFNHRQFAEANMSEEFVQKIGIIAQNSILDQPYVYFDLSSKEDPYKAAEQNGTYTNAFLGCLWFIKDNAIFATKCYAHNDSVNITTINNHHVIFSDSSGSYTPTVFSPSEIISAIDYFQMVNNLMTKEAVDFEKRTTIYQGTHNVKGQINSLAYNTHNRIFRS